MHIRDMMQLSAVLDYFIAAGKPLHITETEIPSQTAESSEQDTVGLWHRQWDQQTQAQWIEQFYKIAFSKPFIETVTYSNFVDVKNAALVNSGLLTEKLEPKNSFVALKKLQKAIFTR